MIISTFISPSPKLYIKLYSSGWNIQKFSLPSFMCGWYFCHYFITVGFFVVFLFHIYTAIMVLLTELQQVKRKLAALAVFFDLLCAASDCIPISPTAVPCAQGGKNTGSRKTTARAPSFAQPLNCLWHIRNEKRWGWSKGDCCWPVNISFVFGCP